MSWPGGLAGEPHRAGRAQMVNGMEWNVNETIKAAA
jgi:hypothetical protein